MESLVTKFFSETSFMPHGHCYFWKPALLWSMAGSDFIIGVAYFAISITLYTFVRRTKIPFSAMILSFGLFILACGGTHFMEILTIWHPYYWISAALKIFTAFVSVITAISLLLVKRKLIFAVESVRLAKKKDEIIFQRERLLSATEKLTKTGSFEWNLESDRLIFSSELCRILGFSNAKEFLKIEDYFDCIPLNERSLVKGRIQAAIAAKSSFNICHEISRADGKNRLVFCSGQLQGPAVAGTYSLTATVQDITEQSRLQQNIEYQNEILKNMREGICLVRKEDNVIVYANPKFEKIFGYNKDELLNRPVGILNADGNSEKSKQLVLQIISEIERFSEFTYEIQNVKKDGTLFWCQATTSKFKHPEYGEVYVAVQQDITDKKYLLEKIKNANEELEARIQERTLELKDSESRFRQITNALPQMIWTATPSGTFDYYNDRWYDFTGFSKGTHEQRNWLTIMPKEDGIKRLNAWENAVKTGKPYELEYRFWDKQKKEYRWHLGRALPLRNEQNEVIKWVGSCTDIHDQKTAEEERRMFLVREQTAIAASQMKSAFLANMSHEIRTPMNAIVGMTSLALETPLSSEQREYIDSVRRASDSLLTVINDILDFSKIEAGKLDIENLDFDIAQMLSDTEKMFQFSTQKKKILLLTDYNRKFDWAVKADCGRIRQVLNNLIGNAVKFTNEGFVKISMELKEENGRKWIVFFVQDSGIGIAPDLLGKLFQPFSQVDSSTTRKFGGTGLGLSISRRLAELMGGSIDVSSEVGKGSSFCFKIPYEKGLVTVSNDLATFPHEIVAHTARILVAEDNIVNQVVALKTLERLGYRAHAVANGLEVLSALQEVEYNLVLMDCQMPELDGYETSMKIRASTNPKIRAIPIIAMTANALSGERERCLAAGMNEYVSKPINSKLLAKAITTSLQEINLI